MKSNMSVLIGTAMALYATLHFYVYEKITMIESLTQAGQQPIVIFLGLMVVAPLLTSTLIRHNLTGLAVPLAWAGYMWMGFVFLFFAFSIALDFYRLATDVGARLIGLNMSRFTLSVTDSTLAAAAAALLATVDGFFSARQTNIEWVRLRTPKIRGRASLRIIQISDLHLGLLVSRNRLRQLVDDIEELQPELIVSTGDLIDMQMDHPGAFADLLRELKPRFGKFAVTGNHEAFAGLDHSLAFTQQAGFTLLCGAGANVPGIINIVGVDDPAFPHQGHADTPAESELLGRYPEEQFTLLLKHQPVVEPASLPRFDLQLSGHTHGGQIFPFSLLVKLFYPAKTGLSRIGDRAQLYVNRGAGTWGPPIRFLASPEITVIELQSDNGSVANQ